MEQEPSSSEPSFALVQSGTPVPEEEVESHVDAIEVTARWGHQVLAVAHLDGDASYWVGAGEAVALPEEDLGAERAALVEARPGGSYVVVPAGAVATLGGHDTIRGPAEIALAPRMTVSLHIGHVTFDVATVRKGRKVAPVGFLASLAGGATGMIGLSFLGHAAIVASLAMFMPKMAGDDADAMSRDQLLLMQKYLNAAALKEDVPPPPVDGPTSDASGGGSPGEAHKGESGAAGTSKLVTTNGHMAFKGTERESAVQKDDKILAATFGMTGLLMSDEALRDPNAPSSPWGADFAGSDEQSKIGKLFGDTIDDAAGFGLGLWGTGIGGGGTADVIGTGRIHTVGGGDGGRNKWGIGHGDGDGLGNGHGVGSGAYHPKGIQVRPNPITTVNGRIPPEVIQRIVRQNFGRFRLCYENGLRSNPGLQGRVTTKFAIGRDGSVSMSQDGGSDLPDQQVVQCIVRSFSTLSFPQPEGGVALVTYPITLTPGD